MDPRSKKKKGEIKGSSQKVFTTTVRAQEGKTYPQKKNKEE